MPDLPYFIQLTPINHFGHTPLGILLLDIPAGFAFFWLFHYLLKRPMLSLISGKHAKVLQGKCNPCKTLSVSRLAILLIALLIGIVSHIIWDAFTHANGWAVLHFALLQKQVGNIGLYKYLQHGSTLTGVALLALFYLKWHKSQQHDKYNQIIIFKPSALVLLTGAAFIISASYSLSKVELSSLASVRYLVGQFSIMFISSTFVTLLLYSSYWHLRNNKQVQLNG